MLRIYALNGEGEMKSAGNVGTGGEGLTYLKFFLSFAENTRKSQPCQNKGFRVSLAAKSARGVSKEMPVCVSFFIFMWCQCCSVFCCHRVKREFLLSFIHLPFGSHEIEHYRVKGANAGLQLGPVLRIFFAGGVDFERRCLAKKIDDVATVPSMT